MSERHLTASQIQGDVPVTILHLSGHLHGTTETELLDRARQAKRKGQTATVRFTGSQVAWNGPNGPTRGKAKVYLDGQYVKTVDLYARTFDARNRIYTKTFADSGAHTLTIKVLGTRGRPVVSIDEFVVWE